MSETDLEVLVEPFKRAVAVPGTFAQQFPEATEKDVEGILADSFGECQLDGLLSSHEITLKDPGPGGTVTPALVPAGQALLLLYGWVRLLTIDLLNRRTHVRYEGPGTVFEEDQGATLLVEIHREMKQRKREIIEQVQRAGASSAFVMVDQAYVKAVGDYNESHLVADVGFNLSVLGALAGR